MLKRVTLLLLFLLSISICEIKCARILGLFSFPAKSMHLAGTILADILAERGHDVTIVSSYKVSPAPKNFKHIFMSEIAVENNDDERNYFELKINPFLRAYTWGSVGVATTDATFRDPEFQRLLRSNQKFDLVIMDILFTEGLMYVSEHFNASLMLYTSADATFVSNGAVGNFAPPSYIPDILTDYTSRMTFFERLDNTLMCLSNHLVSHFYTLPAHNELVKKYIPGAPDLSKYYHKASVLLVNSDASVSEPVPKLPGMIDIGGFHVKSPKPLPKDLDHIVNSSKHGVIFFSLGSNLKSTQMPKNVLNALLKVFSKLNQTILWKWEDEQLHGKPANVVIRKWLPQNDILAHKNVKLFITHGGFHSVIETAYHGVPCVVLPVFEDQLANSKRISQMGYGEWIKLRDVTADKMEWALNQVLNDPRYSAEAERRSNIMRDKPMSQVDTLSFWVDYVIRHKGADHLKVASLKLSWYQYLLLDVISFVIMGLIVLFSAVKYLLKFLVSQLNKKQRKTKTN